jgi:adenylate cyclase
LTGDERQQAFAQARIALDKQLALAPNSAHTHTDRGYLLTLVDGDPIGALAEYQRAYALEPNNGTKMNFLAAGLQTVGRLPEAVDLYRKAIATDPLRAVSGCSRSNDSNSICRSEPSAGCRLACRVNSAPGRNNAKA